MWMAMSFGDGEAVTSLQGNRTVDAFLPHTMKLDEL